jgi:hypothetical protein
VVSGCKRIEVQDLAEDLAALEAFIRAGDAQGALDLIEGIWAGYELPLNESKALGAREGAGVGAETAGVEATDR